MWLRGRLWEIIFGKRCGRGSMHTNLSEFLALLEDDESGRLEFKAAKSHYDFEELLKYCAALANEGGGKMILGVSDKKPRAIVGTAAFQPVDEQRQDWLSGCISESRLRPLKPRGREFSSFTFQVVLSGCRFRSRVATSCEAAIL
jgi:hypothetical protein